MKKETISITKKIGREISSIFQNHRSLFYLILIHKNKTLTSTEEELAKSIPEAIYKHKFLTNSPENYLNHVDKHYSDKFELEDE